MSLDEISNLPPDSSLKIFELEYLLNQLEVNDSLKWMINHPYNFISFEYHKSTLLKELNIFRFFDKTKFMKNIFLRDNNDITFIYHVLKTTDEQRLYIIRTLDNDKFILKYTTRDAKRNHTNNIWKKAYDISRINYNLKIGNGLSIRTISIYMYGPTEFLNMTPKPDVIANRYIMFTNPDSIEYIKKHGLTFFAKFPELENKQNMRIFVITSLLTVLITLFFKFSYDELKKLKIRPKLWVTITILVICILSAIFMWYPIDISY